MLGFFLCVCVGGEDNLVFINESRFHATRWTIFDLLQCLAMQVKLILRGSQVTEPYLNF